MASSIVSGPIFTVDTRFSRCCLVVRWAGNLEVRDASELIPFSTARELLMEKTGRSLGSRTGHLWEMIRFFTCVLYSCGEGFFAWIIHSSHSNSGRRRAERAKRRPDGQRAETVWWEREQWAVGKRVLKGFGGRRSMSRGIHRGGWWGLAASVEMTGTGNGSGRGRMGWARGKKEPSAHGASGERDAFRRGQGIDKQGAEWVWNGDGFLPRCRLAAALKCPGVPKKPGERYGSLVCDVDVLHFRRFDVLPSKTGDAFASMPNEFLSFPGWAFKGDAKRCWKLMYLREPDEPGWISTPWYFAEGRVDEI